MNECWGIIPTFGNPTKSIYIFGKSYLEWNKKEIAKVTTACSAPITLVIRVVIVYILGELPLCIS